MDVTFDAALYALRQHFPRATTQRSEGRIQSEWIEYDQRGGTGRFRDEALKFRNRMRHRATIVVSEAESGSTARCRVEVERLDTADHRVFQQQSQFDDLPNATPIEAEAGTSTTQNQVWTPVSRDHQLERTILAVTFNRTSESPPSGS